MGDQKLTDLTQFSVLSPTDLIYGVDVSDHTMSASGSSKGLPFQLILDSLSGQGSQPGNLTGLSGVLQNQITLLSNHTGDYYQKTNPNHYLVPSGDGGALINVVNTTGDQTINGYKTFQGGANFQGAILVADVRNASSVSIIDPSNLNLVGGIWSVNTRVIASEPWHAQGTLTTITPGTSPTQPVATMSGPWSTFADGDTITINFSGANFTFEFDNDSNVAGGNFAVTIVSGDDNGTAGNLISAISSAISGVSVSSLGGSDIQILGNTAGSSQSITFPATSTNAGPSLVGGYGSDGTPESGTRFATLQSASNPLFSFITEVAVYVDTTAWTESAIEIGYWNGSSFNSIFVIPQTLLTAGNHLFPVEITFSNGGIAAYYGGSSLDIVAMTTDGNGTPLDELGGGNATIYIRGYYAHS